MNVKKMKSRLILLQIGSFIVSIAPLVIVLIINWGKYTKTPGETVKLCIGGIMVAFFIFLKVIGKLKMPRRIVLFGVVFIMAYLLQAIMNDMILLSGMALLGEFMDMVCFQGFIKKLKDNILIGKTANATTDQVEKVIQKYIGNGRV